MLGSLFSLRFLAWKKYPSTLRFIATQGASDLITTTSSSRPYCIDSMRGDAWPFLVGGVICVSLFQCVCVCLRVYVSVFLCVCVCVSASTVLLYRWIFILLFGCRCSAVSLYVAAGVKGTDPWRSPPAERVGLGSVCG